MIIRALNNLKDWTFGNGVQSYLNNDKAIAQNIETRVNFFLNDCFFDMTSGIDWFRLLGTNGTKEEIILSVRAVILQSYGVVKVNKIDATVDGRDMIIQYDIDTIFTSNFAENIEVVNA
ncbi:hypothetical protein EKK58_10080 [Candidatus Dependentiae bacterium]|nr:MAG: hypothetical protein EKK58_10080 [Candidatus Dependentiae bacterium]